MSEISFNNFKPFGEKLQSFSKKPITLVYGPNSIGKSSFLHFIAYLHTIQEDKYLDIKEINSGETISLNGFRNFVHEKDVQKVVRLKYPVKWMGLERSNIDLLESLKTGIFFKEGDIYREIGVKDYRVVDLNIKFFIDKEVFLSASLDKRGTFYTIILNTEHNLIKDEIQHIKENGKLNQDEFNEIFDPIKPIEMTLKKHIDGDFFADIEVDEFVELAGLLNNWTYKDEKSQKKFGEYYYTGELLEEVVTAHKLLIIHFLKKVTKRNVNKIHYMGPLRFYPDRGDTLVEINPYRDKERYSSYKIQQKKIDSNLFWKDLFFESDVVHKLNKWLLNERLNLPYLLGFKMYFEQHDLHSPKYAELFFVDKRSDTPVHHREIGLGLTQLIPVMANVLTKKNSTIMIEQPELHLHPALQMEIADEFIRSYKEQGNEFFIETHSEHLLLRIMKRMRHTAEDKEGRDKTLDLTPEDVCLLYVDNDGESTYVQEIRLSEEGTLLDHWPSGFFEEGYNERFS